MRQWMLLAVAVVAVSASGCKKSTAAASTAVITIVIAPTATQTLTAGGTVTFTATVTNAANTTVTWQVNGITGGGGVFGSISTSGVYTAPATVINDSVVTISAVSNQDNTTTASTSVQIVVPPAVAISPASATVAAGGTQTFTATVLTTESSDNIVWEVNNNVGGTPAVGTISPQGVYTAPQVPPPGGQVLVEAALQVDSTQVAGASTVITYSNFSLQHSFAFLLHGRDLNGPFARAGSFTADGNGHLTGIEDINGSGFTSTAMAFTGSYSISANGTGTLNFNDGFGSHFQGASGSSFSLVMVSAQQVQLSEFDTFASGSGEADLQDTSSFTGTAFNGNYTFDFSGQSASSTPKSVVGYFNADGTQGTAAGLEDINQNGSLTSSAALTFFYQFLGPDGRGTATITDTSGTTNYAYYMVSAGRVHFVELDAMQVVAGDALLQDAPAGAGFSAALVSGSCLVETSGSGSAGPVVTSAVVSADGLGTVRGTLYQNSNGSITSGASFTGTYAVAANGRGTMSFSGGQTYVFYLVQGDQGVFQETDNAVTADGTLATYKGTPLSTSQLSGSLIVQWTGVGSAQGEQDATGQFVVANLQLTGGSLNLNTSIGPSNASGFTPVTNLSFNAGTAYQLSTVAGTVTLIVNGTPYQFTVFLVTPTSAFIMRTDSTDARVLYGSIAKQF